MNFCDGGSPYYDSYETSNGPYVVVAALEPQFYAALLDRLGLSASDLPDRDDQANWPRLKKLLADIFITRSRGSPTKLADGSDACVTPVLTFSEAPGHPHNAARSTIVEAFEEARPAPGAPVQPHSRGDHRPAARTRGAVGGDPAGLEDPGGAG